MRKIALAFLGAALMVVSAVQIAAAAERYSHKSNRERLPETQQFRNASDSLAWPSVEQRDWSDYSEGHVISAPAGH
jgi:hypothetical protein